MIIACAAGALWAAGPVESDWPMLAHDAARTGATTAEVRPPFERIWYRLFPDEGLMAGVQPIVAGGKVFAGTLAGKLYALDRETGATAWSFAAGGPILHTCAVGDGRVFFGCADGKIYAVSAADGAPLWTVPTGAAVWNAPALHDGIVYIGSRDGALYAIDAATGRIAWRGETGGPLLSSPAVDARRRRVYAASEDMRVYAFDLADGAGGDRAPAWKSPKLPGVTFRGYHPVIAPDGSVMVTTAPAISLDAFTPILLDMVKAIFGDFASWRHTKEENERLRRQNFEVMAKSGTYEEQLAYLRSRLAKEPSYQTFFVLDPETGEQRFVAPIVYAESMNGVGAPPIVTPGGRVIVKYQALLRSRYEHYSPFLNVGYLDTSTGSIAPIMDQTRTYGWHDSLLLVHDEQCQLTLAGRVLINTHQDNVNAMDLDTLRGYGEPFCRNIHEPQPGEAVGIWTLLLRDQPLPPGKEWLSRGTAVYGGGSVIDTAVSVAGDTFFYVPAHEINAGCAIIAYRMQAGGSAGRDVGPVKVAPTALEVRKILELPWDWDILGMSRLTHVLKSLPGAVPGTRLAPLAREAADAAGRIADAELAKYVWEAATFEGTDSVAAKPLREALARSIRELVATQWAPLVFPCGKHPGEAYRFFAEPTETLFTLARAYPYVDADLQREIRAFIAKFQENGGALVGGVGAKTFDPDHGAVRSRYDPPPKGLAQVRDDILRTPLARLYPVWLWAHVTGEWESIKAAWPGMRGLVDEAASPRSEDRGNGALSGLIAYARIAGRMGDSPAIEKGLAKAGAAIRERLAYEFAHTRGGLIDEVPVLRSILGRWRHLTPEVGRLLAEHAGATHRHLVERCVDYHRPTWFLAWNVETLWRNESPFEFPTVSAEIFGARSLILREPAEKLARFLDIPWCSADLFHIQKLVFCIEATGRLSWRDVRAARGE